MLSRRRLCEPSERELPLVELPFEVMGDDAGCGFQPLANLLVDELPFLNQRAGANDTKGGPWEQEGYGEEEEKTAVPHLLITSCLARLELKFKIASSSDQAMAMTHRHLRVTLGVPVRAPDRVTRASACRSLARTAQGWEMV